MKCIDATGVFLTEGAVYTANDYQDGVYLVRNDSGYTCAYGKYRFVEVTEEAPADTSAFSEQVGGSHYKDMAIQPLEYIMANGIPFAEGNVIKYLSRWRKKNGLQDLEKGLDMMTKIVESVRNGTYA